MTQPPKPNVRFEFGGGRWVLRGLPEIDPTAFTFKPFRPGVDRADVFVDPETHAATALLRYVPGARIPAHRHVGYEHILILSGSQCDDDGVYGPGTLLIHAPGSQHSVRSDEGCLVIAIWERPVEFV